MNLNNLNSQSEINKKMAAVVAVSIAIVSKQYPNNSNNYFIQSTKMSAWQAFSRRSNMFINQKGLRR